VQFTKLKDLNLVHLPPFVAELWESCAYPGSFIKSVLLTGLFEGMLYILPSDSIPAAKGSL